MIESERGAPTEVLTFSPADRELERWLQRAVSGTSRQLEALRQRVLAAAEIRRHHVVLDLNAGTGLLTWEAVRLTPEGSVWALAIDAPAAEVLRQEAARLPELARPTILQGGLDALPALLAAAGQSALRFDAIVGRNAFTSLPDKTSASRLLAGLIAPGGTLSLAETVPRLAQRLYQLVDLAGLGEDLAGRIVAAEEAIYSDPADPMVNWDVAGLEAAFAAAGLDVHVSSDLEASERAITPAQLGRWFDMSAGPARRSYGQRLLAGGPLTVEELARYRVLLTQATRQPVAWTTATAYVVARPGAA